MTAAQFADDAVLEVAKQNGIITDDEHHDILQVYASLAFTQRGALLRKALQKGYERWKEYDAGGEPDGK